MTAVCVTAVCVTAVCVTAVCVIELRARPGAALHALDRVPVLASVFWGWAWTCMRASALMRRTSLPHSHTCAAHRSSLFSCAVQGRGLPPPRAHLPHQLQRVGSGAAVRDQPQPTRRAHGALLGCERVTPLGLPRRGRLLWAACVSRPWVAPAWALAVGCSCQCSPGAAGSCFSDA